MKIGTKVITPFGNGTIKRRNKNISGRIDFIVKLDIVPKTLKVAHDMQGGIAFEKTNLKEVIENE